MSRDPQSAVHWVFPRPTLAKSEPVDRCHIPGIGRSWRSWLDCRGNERSENTCRLLRSRHPSLRFEERQAQSRESDLRRLGVKRIGGIPFFYVATYQSKPRGGIEKKSYTSQNRAIDPARGTAVYTRITPPEPW